MKRGRVIAVTFLACSVAGVLLAAGSVVAARWWDQAINGPGPLDAPKTIIVPRGNAAQLAELLRQQGAIRYPLVFRASAALTAGQGSLRAAEFSFAAHASVADILTTLRTARPVQHHLTIPEGLTARQIQALVARADSLTGDAALAGEGAVLPQTYDYEHGVTRAAVLERARVAMARELAAAWKDRAPGLPLASPREAVTLASIVERETARPAERAHVAAVYLNRLRLGMRLEADPTVAYAASAGAGVLDRPISKADLRRDDPFNTYRNPGLPPGPICAPGLEAIKAVLHPAASDDLYFVADGSGGHVFSHDFAAHEAAVKTWRLLGAHGGAPDGAASGAPKGAPTGGGTAGTTGVSD